MTIQSIAQQAISTQMQQTASATRAAPAKSTTAAKAQSDSVTISKQAMLLNSPGYSATEEMSESPAAKAAEKTKGQR